MLVTRRFNACRLSSSAFIYGGSGYGAVEASVMEVSGSLSAVKSGLLFLQC